MNRSELIGNITDELEIKMTQTNKAVLDFSVAVNEGYGEKRATSYIPCRAWEKTAENIANYCHKGDKIYIEGKFKTDSWEKDGKKQYKSYVLVTNTEFLQPKPKENKVIQETLTGDGRDMLGHMDRDVKIETDDLPFY